MNKVAEYILDVKFIDNKAYIEALNHDFEKFSVEVFMMIRYRLSKALDIDDALRGKVTPEKVEKTKYEVNYVFSRNGIEGSAVRDWLLEELGYIGIIVDDEIQEEKARAARLVKSIPLNGKIVGVFEKHANSVCVVDAICDIVKESYMDMDLVNIITMIFGLRNLSVEICFFNGAKIKNLLIVLAKMLEENKEPCQAWDIAHVLCGLNKMDDSFVPRELLDVVVEKLKVCDGGFKSSNIFQVSCGLKCLSGAIVPKELFVELAKRIEMGFESYSVFSIKEALYCLFGFKDGEVPEEYFAVLERQLSKRIHDFTALDVQKSLYGILKFNGESISRIKNELLERLFEFRYEDSMADATVCCLVQDLSIMGIEWPEWLRMKYDDLVDRRVSEKPEYRSERRALRFLTALGVDEVEFNYFVDGFELDFYFPGLHLNIEIDGDHHAFTSIKDDRRDDYLRSAYNMHVVRLNSDCKLEDALFDALFEEVKVEVAV